MTIAPNNAREAVAVAVVTRQLRRERHWRPDGIVVVAAAQRRQLTQVSRLVGNSHLLLDGHERIVMRLLLLLLSVVRLVLLAGRVD